eukprot:SAG11_NODE_1447_length_4888_cov_2.819795_3_plen_145_part_00
MSVQGVPIIAYGDAPPQNDELREELSFMLRKETRETRERAKQSLLILDGPQTTLDKAYDIIIAYAQNENLSHECLMLAFNYVERFLAAQVVDETHELQVICVACLFLCLKLGPTSNAKSSQVAEMLGIDQEQFEMVEVKLVGVS